MFEPRVSLVLEATDDLEALHAAIDAAAAVLEARSDLGEVIVWGSLSADVAEGVRRRGAIPLAGNGESSARDALEAVRGDVVAFASADGRYDLAEINRLLDRLEDGAVLAMGDRRGDAGERRSESVPGGGLGLPIVRTVLRTTYGLSLDDPGCAFRAMDGTLVAELRRSELSPLGTAALLEAAGRGARIDTVSVGYRPDETESGEFTLSRAVRFAAVHASGDVYLAPGLLGALLGSSLLLGSSAGLKLAVGSAVIGLDLRTLVIGSLLTLAGVQLVYLGLFVHRWGAAGRRPPEPLTRAVADRLDPAGSAWIALALLGGSATVTLHLGAVWLNAGLRIGPAIDLDLVVLTAVLVAVSASSWAVALGALADRP